MYGPMGFGPMGYGWGSGWGLLGFGLHGLVMLAFLALLIWVAVVVIRRTTQGPASPAGQDTAMGLLRERFARGELTREQFDTMREALR
jgi:putative membrane protein